MTAKPVTVCVPVMTRYDLLRELLMSLRVSTLRPARVIVFNCGRSDVVNSAVADACDIPLTVVEPSRHTGLAEVINWFIRNTVEERVITNDDVVFGPDTLSVMVASDGDVVGPRNRPNEFATFSCFLLRDSCVAKVGVFDELISPGYIYFEDCDYGVRMARAGATIVEVDCNIRHGGSQTLRAMTPEQQQEHHRKFQIAARNYHSKWGGEPQHEVFSYPNELVPGLSLPGLSVVCHEIQ
jgi:GT2 family glycosyltransferase